MAILPALTFRPSARRRAPRPKRQPGSFSTRGTIMNYQVGNFDKGQNIGTVSTQWASRPHDQRFLSLVDLETSVLDRFEQSTETRIKSKSFELIAPEAKTIEDTHRLTIGLPDGSERGFSHWSFGQLCQLAGAPASYLREQPTQNVASNLMWDLRHRRDVSEVKTYQGPDQLHAITGPDYGRIPDHEVVRAVKMVAGNGIGDTRWKIPGVLDWSTMIYNPDAPVTKESTTLYASDRDVFMFLVDDRNPIEVGKLPNGEPDYMFRGFYIQNSEVGSKTLKLAAFYLRGVCMNRNLWGVEGFEELSIRHTRLVPDRFLLEAQPALLSYAEGSSMKLIEGVAKAKAAIVAKDEEEALNFLQGLDLSKKRAQAVWEIHQKEEQAPIRNVWDAAQGLTALARGIPNQDDRIDLELTAKRILDKVA